jgi:2-hydroxychromene-2-carboxylate isomerase
MGVVVDLDEHRRRRRPADAAARAGGLARVELCFDLGDPFLYLAAERVDRAFDAVTWIPATGAELRRRSFGTGPDDLAAMRVRVQARAAELRMPIVWPDRFPAQVPGAMRVASLAAEQGRAAAFVLATCRLAFCGGFDVNDPEILAEAAAAAGLGVDACLDAAGDASRDAAMESEGRRLLARGAGRLPVLRVGGTAFCGEDRIAEAAVAARYAAVN